MYNENCEGMFKWFSQHHFPHTISLWLSLYNPIRCIDKSCKSTYTRMNANKYSITPGIMDKCPHLILGLVNHTGRCISGRTPGIFWSAGLEDPALRDGTPSASSSAPAWTAGCTPPSSLDVSYCIKSCNWHMDRIFLLDSIITRYNLIMPDGGWWLRKAFDCTTWKYHIFLKMIWLRQRS